MDQSNTPCMSNELHNMMGFAITIQVEFLALILGEPKAIIVTISLQISKTQTIIKIYSINLPKACGKV